MKNCSGIIISSNERKDYGALSKTRPDYMLPYGGRYRIIDFALSNMSNYKMSTVMLYAGRNVRSTLDHIGDGKNWELNRRSNGLMINPPSFDELTHEQSELHTFYDSLPHFQFSKTEHIYIENPMAIAKVNLQKAYEEYLDKDYDALLMYESVSDQENLYYGMYKLILDSDHRLVNVGMNLGIHTDFNLYFGRLFIKKKVFLDLVTDSMEKGNAQTLIQAIAANKSRLKIGCYDVNCHVEIICDINSYYQSNLRLLDPRIYQELFYQGGLVYTKSKDEPSALYKEGAQVANSLIANGCIIDGQVENSILFRGVYVHKNAIVRNCILFQKTDVSKDAVVINTITDKYAQIGEGITVAGAVSNPYLVAKSEKIKR